MTFAYIDAHCHLQFPHYDTDREDIIAKMRAQNIGGIVVGCDTDTSTKAVALAEAHEHLYASVGQHPNNTMAVDEVAVRALLAHPKVVAVGECGLDYFRPSDTSDEVKRAQRELFQKQISLAAEFDKPLVIHARPSKGSMDAYEDIISLLTEAKRQHPHLRGDAHFFAGGVAQAQALIALDFTVSFTAVVTFAREYDEVIKHVPLTAILAETDAPYVAPASRRGTRNDPLAVVEVAQSIATILGEDGEVVRKALLETTMCLFATG